MPPSPLPFDPTRFLAAQDPLIHQVRAELAAGRKRTHWMWFVFPQLAGLARSDTARFYALHTLQDAKDWLAHPILGPRLRDCTALVNAAAPRPLADILGGIDALKFRSCMTLFAAAAPADPLFAEALALHGDGQPDPQTLALL
ncbi:DUF1810 domain-containing protein [Falsiroseomonas stagni]|uniref:Uncharacterized protein, DUF1810 family n=1 Tax=Falsiroseomonas stagni DSM 19981 TaxID=1123062 RepID=A0A1I4D783_9PROT|nr:DUF1810 domain-containing protein [Falsiroseomonas stagni]SFK87831.1 Uncharacterized protein, DUF1810 family [Falsiroseomonas stagni DSM 19981]